uniref:hypothetical protein n=1 Tax=Escherichia coli TaxID=562 RepID=UPI0019622CA5
TLLSHIAIACVVKDDNDDMADPLIQYRIVGTLLTEHVGKELRGVWLHEIGYHLKPNPIKELYYEAIDTKSPTIARKRYKEM